MHSFSSASISLRFLHKIQLLKWSSGRHTNYLHNCEIIKPLFCSSSRIICTDSKRQVAHNHQFQSISSRQPEQESCPVIFLKDITKNPESQYLKLITVPSEYHGIEACLKTAKLNSIPPSTLFFYDVNLAENSKNPLPYSSVYFYSFEDIYNSSIYHVKSHQVPHAIDEVLFAGSSDVKGNDTGRPTEQQLLYVIERLTQCLLGFFEKPHDFSIYHKNVIFQNNVKGVTIKGLAAYVQAIYILKLYGYVQYAKVKVEILKITHHVDDGSVRVRWRVKGVSRHKVLLKLWKLRSMTWQQFVQEEAEWLDGFSVFSVGTDGLIFKHICDKMTPNDDTVASKKIDLKSRLLGLFDLNPRGPAAGSLNTLFPCYRHQAFSSSCKKLT